MSKYIVDTDSFESMFKVDSIGVFGIGKSVTDNTEDHSWSRIKSVVDFDELNSDYINEHYRQLQDDAYQKGFEDGKAVNDKGCEGCKYAGKVLTGPPCISCCNSYKNQWTAKDDKIEVGDEVIYNGTTKCIVVRPEDDERYASLIDGNGTHYSAYHRECKKTGRHFDIEKILEEMRG